MLRTSSITEIFFAKKIFCSPPGSHEMSIFLYRVRNFVQGSCKQPFRRESKEVDSFSITASRQRSLLQSILPHRNNSAAAVCHGNNTRSNIPPAWQSLPETTPFRHIRSLPEFLLPSQTAETERLAITASRLP